MVIIFLVACSPSSRLPSDGKINVTVSILPEKFFAERIGGDMVIVNVMVGPGDSPHTYEPKPEQMAALSRSAIYFTIGVEFEGAWMDKISSANPKMKIVDLSEGIDRIPMIGHGHQEDGHESDDTEDHESEELDPHIWTSPQIAKTLAQKIAVELTAVDPQNADTYQANLESLLLDIEQLQNNIQMALESAENRRFLVFHPAWGYFASEFDLEEIAIEIGGTEPSASELAAIINTAKKENIRVVFAQPEFSTQIASYIAKEINGKVILVSPLAETWLENLRSMAQSLEENL